MSLRAVLLGSALMCFVNAAYAECSFEPRIPTSRYEIQGDRVFDKETRLTWQRCALGQKWTGSGCAGEPRQLSWTDATKLKGAWRLPTKEELNTLVSDACLRNVNTEAFPGVSLQYPSYWSSSVTDPDLTWTVDLTNGHPFNSFRTSYNAAMLVQGQGQVVAQASSSNVAPKREQ